jgi:hypothetical protein
MKRITIILVVLFVLNFLLELTIPRCTDYFSSQPDLNTSKEDNCCSVQTNSGTGIQSELFNGSATSTISNISYIDLF